VGKFDEAIRCFEAILERAPRAEYMVRPVMALTYDSKGDKPAALREIDKAMKALDSSSLKDEKKAKLRQMLETMKNRLGSL
jgi:tetratricopeptide (TPR) repeat protein